jgi:hypothetical protein
MHESVIKSINENHPELLDRIKSGELTLLEIVDSMDKPFDAMCRSDDGHILLFKEIDILQEITCKNILAMRTIKWKTAKEAKQLSIEWFQATKGQLPLPNEMQKPERK